MSDDMKALVLRLREHVSNCAWMRNASHMCSCGIKDRETAADVIERLERENICDACLGTGKPISGLECMCGGSGKMSDAVPYLRQRVVDLERELAEARGEVPDRGGNEHDPEWDEIPPFDPAKAPRCPKCRTYGHQHRKDCLYRDKGMEFHIWPGAHTTEAERIVAAKWRSAESFRRR